MKKVTKRWLEKHNACASGMAYYRTLKCTDGKQIIISCLDISRFDWAVWVLVRLMTPKQRLAFAIWCSEKVLPVWEATNPEDMRPRKAIDAAKRVLRRNTKEARYAAAAAATAAHRAYYAAVRDAASNAAAVAAYAASADAAYAASADDAYDAADAAADANSAVKKEIVLHGLQIIGYSQH